MQLPISVGPRVIIDSYFKSSLASFCLFIVKIYSSSFKKLSMISEIVGSFCLLTTVVGYSFCSVNSIGNRSPTLTLAMRFKSRLLPFKTRIGMKFAGVTNPRAISSSCLSPIETSGLKMDESLLNS